MSGTDLWATEHADPVEATKAKFRASLVRRAEKREVLFVPEDGNWVVLGRPDMGDAFDNYRVHFNAGRYSCTCQTHAGGEYRKMCSHVLAVILWRKRAQKKEAAVRAARKRVAARGAPKIGGAASPTPRQGEGEPAATGEAVPDQGAPPPPTIPAVSDPRFGNPPLPERFTEFRPTQWEAIEKIMAAFDSGARVVFCQAPTGSGKSLIGETVRRLLGGKAVYVATTKALQDQMVDSFPYAAMLKGRSNYEPTGAVTTNQWGETVPVDKGGIKVTCADCTRQRGTPDCRWCVDVMHCPYQVAKNEAAASNLAVLNTAYWLTDINLGPATFSGRDLAIIDEADTLEGELMGIVEVKISKARQRYLQLDPPPKKTVETSWGEWVDRVAIPRVWAAIKELPPIDDPEATPKQIRNRKGLTNLLDGLTNLSAELAEDPTSWVYDGYQRGEIIFRPVRVAKWGEQYVWRHAKRFLLMSATIISAQEMADSLGLSEDYAVVDVPMTFPVENRPVKVVPVAEMTNKQAETAWPKMAYAIAQLLPMHPGERVLIHTVSYKLADYLWGELRRRCPDRVIVRYGNSGEKDEALRRYLRTPGAVMVAPSMDRGVDLPHDACRVQVIAKVPFPNLGDKQVNKRLHSKDGQAWYSVQTVRSLVQMTGRGVRSPEDHAVTYIFDHSFTTNIWRKSKMLLPKWWVEALDWRTDPRKFIQPRS